MKFICKKCEPNSGPCALSIAENEIAWPIRCPYGLADDVVDWKELKEVNMSGKDCYVGLDRNYCADNCKDAQSKDRLIQDRLFSDSGLATVESKHVEQCYTADSIVSTHKDKIEKLAKAHWKYVDKVIRSGADTGRTFTFEEVMAIREWDYTSAAIHFYGHGLEDGEKAMAEKTLDRLKGA